MSTSSSDDTVHSAGTSPIRRSSPTPGDRSSLLPITRCHPEKKYLDRFRKDFFSHIKIGSSYYIGTHKRNYPTSQIRPSIDQIEHDRCRNASPTSAAFLRHPLNLVLAREQGDIGPAHRLTRRLRYRASRWRVESSFARRVGLQVYGEKTFEPTFSDPQTFQELIQGSLWSVSRLNLEAKFECHTGCVNTLQFNSTGDWIASGSDDLAVVVTSWAARQQVTKFNTGHTQNIFHVKFLPECNDTRLVSCSCDSEVRLAQLRSDGSLAGDSTRLLVEHADSCHKLAIPAGEASTVLSAGADGRVYSIDVRAPQANCILHRPRSQFFSIASHPVRPHEIALCGKSEAIVRIYDRRNMDASDQRRGYLHYFGADDVMNRRRKPEAAFGGRSAGLPEVLQGSPADSTDTSSSSSASELDDTSNSLFNSVSAQLGRQIREQRRRTRRRWLQRRRNRCDNREGTFAVDGRHVQDGLIDGAGYQKSDYCITSAQYSAQGDVLLASYNDDDIYLFDVQRPSERYIHKYTGHRNMPTIVSAAFFGPNSEYIVSGSDDGFFYIWDRESEGIVQWLFADAIGAVNVVESHPSLPILASAGLDYDYKLWSPIRPLEQEPDYEYQSIRRQEHLESSGLRNSVLERYLFPESVAEHATSPASQESHSSSRCQSDNSLGISPMETSETASFGRKRPYPCVKMHATQSHLQPAHDLSPAQSAPEISKSIPDKASALGKLPKRENGSDTWPSSSSAALTGATATECNGRPYGSQTVAPSSSTATLGNQAGPSNSQSVCPPQSLMPFKVRDLELQVAQNWCNRLNERRFTEIIDPSLLAIVDEVAEVLPAVPARWMTPAIQALWSDSLLSPDRDEMAAASTDSSLRSIDQPVASSQDLDAQQEDEEGDMETNSSQATLSSISSLSEPSLL